MNILSFVKKHALIGVASLALVGMTASCSEEILNSLTSGNTVAALKEALTIGAKAASKKLGSENGFLMDAAVKIGVPKETEAIFELAKTDAGKTFLKAAGAEIFDEEQFVELMNRAAEKAAPESAEIFANAITSMTIADGEEILFGAENAATNYLHEKTYSGLQTTFGDVVTGTFDMVKVGGKSLNDAWDGISVGYNKIADFKSTNAGQIAMASLKIGLAAAGKSNIYSKIDAIQPMKLSLGEYVTGKALDGLFSKVEEKELDIRTNVAARTSDLLKNVFGRLDTEK